VVSYDTIAAKNYSLSAGQYFEVKIEYNDITKEDFESRLSQYESKLDDLFSEARHLETKIRENLKGIRYE
jgi:type I restriction enzyme M protein